MTAAITGNPHSTAEGRPGFMVGVSATGVQEVYRSAAVTIATWRTVVLIELRESPPHRDALRLLDTIQKHARICKHPVGLLYVLRLTNAPPPEADTREVYRKIMRDDDGNLDGCAVVSDQEGFTGAMVRSIITGLILLARPRFSVKVYSDMGQGAAWLNAELGKRGHDFGGGAGLEVVVRKVFPQEAAA